MKAKRVLLFLITLPFLSNCGGNRMIFKEMEGYVKECPDSALNVLERISVQSERDRSYHTLYYAEAMDSYYGVVGLNDDRDISSAASYFDRKGPQQKRLQAWYYLGKTRYFLSDLSGSIIAFLNAEKVASSIGDNTYLADIYTYISNIYSRSSNYLQSAVYMGKALENRIRLSDASKTRTAMVDYAEACRKAGLYSQADSVYWNSLYYSHAASDTLNEVRTLVSYAGMKLDENPSEEFAQFAIESFSRVTDQLGYTLSGEETAYLAYALAIEGDPRYENVLQNAYDTVEGAENTLSVDRIAYRIYTLKDNKEKALDLLRKIYMADRERKSGSTVSISHMDYLLGQKQLQEERERNSRLRLGGIILFLMAVLATLILYFHARKSQNQKLLSEEKAETEKYMSIAEDLQTRISDIQSKSGSKSADSSYKMSGLDALERLCEQYYVYEGTDNLQPKILKEVRSIIEGLRNDPSVKANLEKTLDDTKEGVMKRLRAAYPKWKEEDFTLYAFTASGFSTTTISTLLSKDKAYIYNRVYRLKGRISSSSSPDKDFFLQCLISS